MKTILLLTTLVICIGLNWATYKQNTPRPPKYTRRPPKNTPQPPENTPRPPKKTRRPPKYTRRPPKYTTRPPKYTPKPTKSPAEKYKEQLDKTWFNPKPSLKKKVTRTVEEYAVWTSLTKFVPRGKKLQPTYVSRFCQCKKSYSKRSVTSRVKRNGDNKKKKDKKKQRGSGAQVIRKEWRMMTGEMRESFIKHFNNLATKGPNESLSRLAQIADWHRESEAPGAHGGPSFLPWHREYLYRLENFLADDGYEGGLPYWNSGLDFPMDKARDSAIFTRWELGTSNGEVSEPFQPNTVSGDCVDANLGSTIKRAASETSDGLFKSNPEADLLMKANYVDFNNDLEGSHSGVHVWFDRNDDSTVHMNHFSCVGYDPIFYMHHAFVDYLWEKYRKRQNIQDRENDYPNQGPRTEAAFHKHSTMKPFDDKLVIDGMKNQYTNSFYRYEESPGDCASHDDCKSDFLWCNSNSRCQGKTKEGGECNRNLFDIQCYCRSGNPSCELGSPPGCACN